jgi:hypothetical protein
VRVAGVVNSEANKVGVSIPLTIRLPATERNATQVPGEPVDVQMAQYAVVPDTPAGSQLSLSAKTIWPTCSPAGSAVRALSTASPLSFKKSAIACPILCGVKTYSVVLVLSSTCASLGTSRSCWASMVVLASPAVSASAMSENRSPRLAASSSVGFVV